MADYHDTALSPQQRAEALVALMTVEEAASQLRYDAPAIERLGVPAYNWWNEGLHGLARSGTATMFPQSIGMAAAFDPDLVEKSAEITALEARVKYREYQKHGDFDIYKGLTIWAPNINIFRDPRWGRGHETFGEDPYLTSQLGKAFIRGMQGDGKVMRAAACAKHFAVHSGPEALRHEFNALASDEDMELTYLPAFEELVKEGVEGVMGAYNCVNGEPACASRFLMGKLEEWGFDGYFVSDCWAIRDFHENHKVTADAVESAAMALNAGCDVNCGCTYTNLLAALEQGLITEEQIRRSCVKLFRTRFRLGLFDEEDPWADIGYDYVSSPENKAVSLSCAERSMVLLENDGLLPLDEKKIKTIAVIGPNADSTLALEGNYCGRADRYITFLRGIQERFSGRVINAQGCELYKDRSSVLAQAGDRYAEALAAAENADVIIACVGLDATIEGEEGDTGNEFSSGDKNDLFLPGCQQELLEKLSATGKPMVIVCAAGSSINVRTKAGALIHAWYAGSEGGTALAEILFGDISPSGKLPVTFYKSAAGLPDFTDYSMKNRTYRYTDGENVLYPFGYGLTYTGIKVSGCGIADGKVKIKAENPGMSGEEVVMVFRSGRTPNPELCGFGRIALGSGESGEFEIKVKGISGTERIEIDRNKIYLR